MTIHFHCPSCRLEFNIGDNMAGSRARCNRCGAVLTVPRPKVEAPIDLATLSLSSPAVSPATSLPVKTQSPLQVEEGNDFRRILVVGVVAGMGLLSIMGIGAWWMSRGDDGVVAKVAGDGNASSDLSHQSVAQETSSNAKSSTGPAFQPLTVNSADPPRKNAFAPRRRTTTSDEENPFKEEPGVSSPTRSTSENPFQEVEENPFQEAGDGESSTDENPFVDVDENSQPPRAGSSSSSSNRNSSKGPSLQAGGWRAEPDPPQQPIATKEGRFSLSLPGNSDILFPMQASQFVLVGAGSGDDLDYASFDLSTGTLFGQQILDGIELNAPRIMSADGKYLAGINGRGDEAKIEVWSFETASRVSEFNAPVDGEVSLFFAGPGQLGLIRQHIFDGLSARLWSIAKKTQLWEKKQLVPNEQLRGATGFVVSHGGKYAVLLAGDKLRVFDLNNGEAVGLVTLAENPSRCYGMAFSPDGKELAALTEISSGAQLLIWDFSNGKNLLNHPYFQRLEFIQYNGLGLEWVPDQSGLLIAGHVLVDRETGDEIWNLPQTNASPRRMTKTDQVLVLAPDEKTKKMMLTGLTLPTQDIAKVRDTVRGGGEAIDSLLPPLTKPDFSSARDVGAPSTTVKWNYATDSVPAPTATLKAQPISDKKGRVLQLRFASPNSSKVLLTREVEQEFKAGRRPPRQFVINSLDLSTGRTSDELPLLPQYELLDASPDGSLALVGLRRQEGGFDRLDVLSIAPKKHIAGWRPYSQEAAKEHQTVSWAFMAANDKVVTCNSFGRLVLWSVPGCRAEYTMDGFGEPICGSLSRQYLVSFQNPSLRIYDIRKGDCRGDLEILPVGARIVRASIRPDGDELIALVDGLPNKTIFRWSLQDGRMKNSFPIPDEIVQPADFVRNSKTAPGLYWIDNRYVLLDGSHLLDVENRSLVWRYHLFPSNFVDVLAGKVWLVGGQDGGAFSQQVLAPLALPTSNTREKAKFLQLDRQLALGPNSKVRIHVQLHGQYARYNQSIGDSIVQRLKELGMHFDPSAPLSLVITSGERSTGEQLALGSGPGFGFGSTSSGQTFSQQAIYLQFALQDSAGKGIWKNEMMIPMRAFGLVQSETAQAASTELRGEMESAFDNALSRGDLPAMLPPYVFKPLDEIIAGTSTISPKGEGPPPEPVQPNSGQTGFGAPAGPFGGGFPGPTGLPF